MPHRQRFVTGHGIAETWEESVRALLGNQHLDIVDTDTGGATIEFANFLLEVREPQAEPRISDRYVNPELIDGLRGTFSYEGAKRPEQVQTLADRMHAWPTAQGKPLDQLKQVVAELRANPTSRRAVVQIWNPEQDLPSGGGGTPSGHCFFTFAIRGGRLNLNVVSRSVDAWTGELPNLVALAAFQQDVAGRLKLPAGPLAHFVISYHIYVRDIPDATLALGGPGDR